MRMSNPPYSYRLRCDVRVSRSRADSVASVRSTPRIRQQVSSPPDAGNHVMFPIRSSNHLIESPQANVRVEGIGKSANPVWFGPALGVDGSEIPKSRGLNTVLTTDAGCRAFRRLSAVAQQITAHKLRKRLISNKILFFCHRRATGRNRLRMAPWERPK